MGCLRKGDVGHCGVVKSKEKACSAFVGETKGEFCDIKG